MEITLEKKDSTNATIQVNLKEADYEPKVLEKVKEYSKKAQIKGFRPGKVPTGVIKKMYGKSILVDEINNLLVDSLNSYIKENNLPIIGDPLPDTKNQGGIDWENQKEFSFNYNIGLIPEFNYVLSKDVKIEKYIIDVDSKIVNETLENLREQFGQKDSAEIIENNDLVTGELNEEGRETKKITIDLKKTKNDVTEQFIGKREGDGIVFEIEKLFDEQSLLSALLGISEIEAKSKKGKVEFIVSNISRTKKADINQEFFDKIFGKDVVTSEEAFKEKLEFTIKDNYLKETDFLLNRDIQKLLTESTSMELPNEFLKKWLLITNQGKITEQQIENEYEFYLKELKWNLIKNKIARDNDIKVEREEVLDMAKAMIKQQFGGVDFGPEMEETLNGVADNYLKQDKGSNYYKLVEEILLKKVSALVLNKVDVVEKNISLDEFKKIASSI